MCGQPVVSFRSAVVACLPAPAIESRPYRPICALATMPRMPKAYSAAEIAAAAVCPEDRVYWLASQRSSLPLISTSYHLVRRCFRRSANGA
jgi:hypothetical protein